MSPRDLAFKAIEGWGFSYDGKGSFTNKETGKALVVKFEDESQTALAKFMRQAKGVEDVVTAEIALAEAILVQAFRSICRGA